MTRGRTGDRRSVPGLPPGTRDPARSRPLPSPLLRLQRSVGNRATAGLVQNGAADRRTLQRDTDEKKPPGKTQRVVAFVIRKKGDQYIQDMRDYLRTTRQGVEVYEVDNFDDIATKAADLAANGGPLDRVLVVSHGQRGAGGLGMKADDGQWEYVLPDKIREWAKTAQADKLRGAMGSGAEVQILGCYLGGSQEAGEAIATAFGATSRASRGEEMVGASHYTLANNKRVTATKDVPKREQEHFRAWLMSQYEALRNANEAPSFADDAAKLAYMTDLFDRSKGIIRSLYVQDPNNDKRQITVGSKEAQDLENTETPRPRSDRKTQFDAP